MVELSLYDEDLDKREMNLELQRSSEPMKGAHYGDC
jgi:hypothetical protein